MGELSFTKWRKWYYNRIKKVYLPYIIVVILDLIILYLMFSIKYSFKTICLCVLNLQGLLHLNRDFFSCFFTKIPNLDPLSFVTVIMICYLLLPLLLQFRNKWCIKEGVFLYKRACIFILLNLLLSIIIQLTTNTLFPFVVFIIGFLYPLFEKRFLLNKLTIIQIIVLLIFTFAVQVGRLVVKNFYYGSFIYDTYTSISHLLLGLAIFIVFICLGGRFPRICQCLGMLPIIKQLDSYSLYIYS